MQIRYLGQKDALGKGKATHSSILAWRIPWTEEPGGLQSMESQRVGHDSDSQKHTHTHTHTPYQTTEFPAPLPTHYPCYITALWLKRCCISFPTELCHKVPFGSPATEPFAKGKKLRSGHFQVC